MSSSIFLSVCYTAANDSKLITIAYISHVIITISMKHTILNYYVGLYRAGSYGTLDSLLYTYFFDLDSSLTCEIKDVF
jgi:hypothetical protein